MEIPYLAIIVAAVAHFVIGMLWYSPLLFGNQWMKYNGFSKADMEAKRKKGMATQMIVSLIASLVMVYVLWYVLAGLGVADLSTALKWAAMIWLGFNATAAIGGVLWEGMKVPLYFIHIGYGLVSYVVLAGIVFQMALAG